MMSSTAQRTLHRDAALDHLRAALVILVVLHHVAVTYSAVAPFYYVEPPFDDPMAFTVLGVFALLNQAWFMGALFFLSGLFAPASVDRRGPSRFLLQRFFRLGPAVLIGVFLLEPLARLGYFLMPETLTGVSRGPQISDYPGSLGLGPLWFAFMLLVFDAGYAGWRRLGNGSGDPKATPVPQFGLHRIVCSGADRRDVSVADDRADGAGVLPWDLHSEFPHDLAHCAVLGTFCSWRRRRASGLVEQASRMVRDLGFCTGCSLVLATFSPWR